MRRRSDAGCFGAGGRQRSQWSLDLVGLHTAELGRLDEAAAACREAMALRERLHARLPADASIQQVLARSCSNVASVVRRQSPQLQQEPPKKAS